MQILVFLLVALVGFSINFGWDLTVRRQRARVLTAARRQARPRALPPRPAPNDQESTQAAAALERFVEHSRETFLGLDQLIDHFDLLLLRARARARFGTVTVHAAGPRAEACALLQRWLEAETSLDEQTRAQLSEIGLAPIVLAGVLARERERASWEFRSDTPDVLEATTTDLDRAVIHLQRVVRRLERGEVDPYR